MWARETASWLIWKGGRLILEKAETIKLRLKARFAGVGKGVSLADELLAERREEVLRKR